MAFLSTFSYQLVSEFVVIVTSLRKWLGDECSTGAREEINSASCQAMCVQWS